MATENSASAVEDDLYSPETPEVVEEAEETATEETSEESDAKPDSSGAPGLLPKGFFSGKELKPGTVCEIKVEKVTDDQVMVSYVPHKSKSDEDEIEVKSESEELMA